MSRRDFVAVSTAAAATALAVEGRAQETPTAAIPAPNVLVILNDQHRIDCLGAYGNRDIATPHLDAIAADGVRFTNSFCPLPVCTPSRYSLISGLYVHEHRGWTNHSTLPPGIDTFPALLKKAGYRTKAVGKMHYTPTYLDVGFEELVLAEQNGPGRWDDDYHRVLRDHGLIDVNDLEDQETEWRKNARPEYWETFGAMASNLPKEFHSTEWIGDRANETLQTWGPSGNLLMAGFIKPHHPFDPPAEYARKYDPGKLALLAGWTEACPEHDLAMGRGYFPNEKLTEPALRRAMAYYYAGIEHIDDQVGKMVRTLKDKGLYDSTLIVFTADHGEYMGCHHMLLKGNHMYDPLIKVPLLVKFPKSAHRGTVSEALVNTTDVAPTILAQAGVRAPDAMKGFDLAKLPDERTVTFAENGRARHVMARTKTRKLLLNRVADEGLFYDLEADPCELHSCYNDPACQDEIKALTKALEEWEGSGPISKDYLDEDAPVIDRPNVPSRADDHRDRMIEYTRGKMREQGHLKAEG